MAYTLDNKCAKNLCKQIVLLQLIIENVVTCFLEHSVYLPTLWLPRSMGCLPAQSPTISSVTVRNGLRLEGRG